MKRDTLPHSADAERAVLGACLLNGAIPPEATSLTENDFFLDSHKRVWRAMKRLAETGAPVDLVSLAEELTRTGELDLVGGAVYISSLTDGIPRLSNIEHYARIIKDKATLRRAVYWAQEVMNKAQAGPEDAAAFLRWAAASLPKPPADGSKPTGLVAVSVEDLLQREIKPREMLLDPILPEQGLAMLYAKRGDGKTYLSLGIAVAVASGGTFLRWKAPRARRVLYVDGELPAKTLQERAAAVIAGSDAEPGPGMLQFITPDLQERAMPDLATAEGQAVIENHLEGVGLVVLDNLSALCRSGKENEGEGWLPVQEWALSLRRRGISVLFDHHAGKNGMQRGTSRREDLLDTIISLKRPADYTPDQGLRAEVHFEKTRALLGDAAKPFEVRLETGPGGAAVWTIRDCDDTKREQASGLFEAGCSIREVAESLGISRSAAGRLRKQWDGTRDKRAGVPPSHAYMVGQRDSRANGGAYAASP